MLNKKYFLTPCCALLAAAFLLVAPSFAAEAAASSEHHAAAGGNPPRAGTEKRQGALYRIKRNGQISYLFGTVHVGAKSFYPLAPEVSRALASATELVVELDTRANDAFQRAVVQHGSYRAGDSIRQHISAATLAELTGALHHVGITVSSVAHLKPWLLANILLGLELERNGFNRVHGIEQFLLANAQEHGTAVTELESADYQLALFDTLDDADAERYLRECLRELADGTSLRKARAVMDAWNSADAAALDALIPDATSGDSVMSRFTRNMLLGKRNPEMAARIEGIMNGGKTAFVGVGLLHLLGANSVPQLLAQRGYDVERMY